MDDDPLTKLKREIEEEVTGHRYVSPIPTAHFELDRVDVPRGENLSGVVVIEAGMEDLWIDRLALYVYGVAGSAGSPHTSTTLLITRNTSLSAGESRQFPVWVAVPEDTPLGSKRLLLTGVPAGAVDYFMVQPERKYTEIAHALAQAAGMELQSWEAGAGGEGVVAHFRPTLSDRPAQGRVDLEMAVRGAAMEGKLLLHVPRLNRKDVLRSFFRPTCHCVPFIFPSDSDGTAQELLALLLTHGRSDVNFPIPALPHAPSVSSDSLPVPSSDAKQ